VIKHTSMETLKLRISTKQTVSTCREVY